MKTALASPVRAAHLRETSRSLSSLPELTTDAEEEIEFGQLADESLRCMALALYEEHKDEPQEAPIVAIESIFNVDDAMSWLPCMTLPPLTEACTPKEQFSAFLRNIVRLRHLVFRSGEKTHRVLSTTEVAARDLSPADVFKYVYRFNRLHRCHGVAMPSVSGRLSHLESTLRLYVAETDCDPDLAPLPHFLLIATQ